jgi:hypothetical protein
MTEWDDRVAVSETAGLIQQIADLANGLDPGTEGDTLFPVLRIKRVVEYLVALVRESDPMLITEQMLARPVARLTQVRDSLTSYSATRELPDLTTANTMLDAALDELTRWPLPRNLADIKLLRNSAAGYRLAVEGLIHKLTDKTAQSTAEMETRIATATASLSGLEDAIAAAAKLNDEQAGLSRTKLSGELDAVAQASRTQFATDLTAAQAELASLTTTVDLQKGRLDTAIAEFQKQFSATEAARAKEAADAAQDRQATFTGLVESIRAEAHRVTSSLESDARTIVADLAEQDLRARKVVDAVGAIGVSGGYGKYAAEQKRNADWLRVVAVGSLLAVLVIGGWYLYESAGFAFDWARVATRLWLTVPLFAIAAYCVAQSGKHRENERQARKIELELAALDPYLSLFEEKERNEIKADLAKRLFGQPLAPVGPDDTVGAPQLLDALIRLVGPHVGK